MALRESEVTGRGQMLSDQSNYLKTQASRQEGTLYG